MVDVATKPPLRPVSLPPAAATAGGARASVPPVGRAEVRALARTAGVSEDVVHTVLGGGVERVPLRVLDRMGGALAGALTRPEAGLAHHLAQRVASRRAAEADAALGRAAGPLARAYGGMAAAPARGTVPALPLSASLLGASGLVRGQV